MVKVAALAPPAARVATKATTTSTAEEADISMYPAGGGCIGRWKGTRAVAVLLLPPPPLGLGVRGSESSRIPPPADSDVVVLADSDRPARALLRSPTAYAALSAALRSGGSADHARRRCRSSPAPPLTRVVRCDREGKEKKKKREGRGKK
ncbi:hypothetical protein [Oryza sativa Japonica Group]|uniref:Uncharacterized protein n=2 Tax=Oryza sativa subsp. japonica TaxID=39947 RepID=Q5NA10_ORYSJ|nr:hypothetical protein [Oryza sativa Japonica Group]BAD81749.1 hypothetical protein [Oryza sativa Japonica Group]